jgi:chloramphenicol 3-O phosphotransferase
MLSLGRHEQFGKTLLAKSLQERLDVVFLNFSIDSILYALPPSDLKAMMQGAPILRRDYRYDRLVDGFHAAIGGLLGCGNRLIVDNALTRHKWKVGFDAAVDGHRTIRIGVTCELEEARRRELKRGDRVVGTVDHEWPIVHAGMNYDLFVDTTTKTPDVIADEIITGLAGKSWSRKSQSKSFTPSGVSKR